MLSCQASWFDFSFIHGFFSTALAFLFRRSCLHLVKDIFSDTDGGLSELRRRSIRNSLTEITKRLYSEMLAVLGNVRQYPRNRFAFLVPSRGLGKHKTPLDHEQDPSGEIIPRINQVHRARTDGHWLWEVRRDETDRD